MSHNIISQVEDPKESLRYEESEAQWLATIISRYTDGECHNQMYVLPKAAKKFGAEGIQAAKNEVRQMHERRCFKAMAVAKLIRMEKERAQDGIMFVSQKQTGEYKGRLAYNGKPTREWLTQEEKSSPTVATESLMLTVAVDAHQRRNVMTLDIPYAFIEADMPAQEVGKRVVMKLRGRLVDWLVQLDPMSYKSKVVYEKGVKVLYLLVEKVIYGMLAASLIWYRKIRQHLESIGFTFNV